MAENLRSEAERLGRAVQVRRAELGLKRPELAKRAELSYPYVSEIENGMKTPSTKALAQLAQALELSTSELMVRAETLDDPPRDTSILSGYMAPDRLFESGPQQGVLGRLPAGPLYDLAAPPPARTASHTEPQDRRLEDLVTAIVRAELAAWVRTELPALMRAEIERLLAERD